MTARSPHGGLVELEASLYRRANDPLCAARVRDGVVNGVLHKADSCSQVHINWQPVDEALGFEVAEPRRWATGRDAMMSAVAAGEFYVLEPSPFAAIDVPRFGSGEHYEFRLRSAWGAAGQDYSQTPPSATITVRIYLFPWGDQALVGPARARTEHERPVDHVWQASFTTASVGYAGAWVTGATRGGGAFATKLVLDRASSAWPQDELAVPNAPGGIEVAPTRTLRVGLGIVASVSLDTDSGKPQVIPLLRALHVQGFVGEAP